VPDFIEADVGYDPEIDDCVAESGCSSPALQAGIDLIERRNNTLLILDASGSMAGSAGGGTKMAAAKQSIARYVTGLPDAMQLGFMVYGHEANNTRSGKRESRGGIDLLQPIGQLNFKTFRTYCDASGPRVDANCRLPRQIRRRVSWNTGLNTASVGAPLLRRRPAPGSASSR
jgi:hypothetical protein